jgi:ABC-type transport system substrate-binding protein
MMELLADGFRDLGLKTTMKTISANLIWRRSRANRYYATLDWLDTPNWDRLLMFDYLPDDRCGYGRAWTQWKTSNGRLGEKPPPWVEEINDIYRAVLAARPDSPAGAAAAKRLKQWMHTQVPMFPIASEVMNPMIVPGNLGNFAHSGMASAAHFAVEQCYFLPADGEKK